jgi:hypothetical protein
VSGEQLPRHSQQSAGEATVASGLAVKGSQHVGFHAAAQLWADKLRTIPSLFARLVYMSRLRRQNCRYFEPELSNRCGRSSCHQVIEVAHLGAFRQWLAMGLRAKTADLKPYIATLGFRGSAVRRPQEWLQLAPQIVPEGASEHERQLFVAAFQAVFRLLDDMERG